MIQLPKKHPLPAIINAISSSDEKLKLIMNAALDAIICINTNGFITFWNPQAEMIFGWKETEAIGKLLSELIIPVQFRKRHTEGMAHYQKTGKGPALNKLLELSAINRSGTEFPIELTIMPIKQESEEFFCAFVRDITERKKADKVLQASYDEKNIILESIADGFFAVDKNWIVTYWNKQAEKMLHTPKNKIVGQHLWEVFSDSINSESYKKYHLAIRTNKVINFEDYYLALDKWYEISAYPSINGLSVYFKDITDRKKSDAAINEINNEKNTILERIDDGFFALDKNSVVTYWNKRAEILLGTKKEDLIGKNLHEVFMARGSKIFYDNYLKAISEKITINFEGYSNLSKKWFAVSAFGSDNGLSVYFKDVTEQKDAEEKLKESELRYRSLIEQATDTICIADSTMKIVDMNPSGCLAFGYSKEEILQLSFIDLLYEEDLDTNPFRIDEMKSGKVILNERRVKRKDGTSIEAELNGKMLDDGRIMIIGRDITERKRAELLLKESNERYSLISRATNDMVWDWDLVTGQVYRNKEGWKKLFGIGDKIIETGLMDDWDNRIHPDDRQKVKEANDEIQTSVKDFFEVECRMLRDDGAYAYIHDRGYIIRNEEGKAVRLIGATQDITQRKEAELQVAKSEMRFRSLVQNGSDLISILNEKGYYLYSSPAVKKILGYEPEFIVGKNAFTFIHPDDISSIKTILKQNKTGKNIGLPAFRYRNAQGEWRWLESKITNMHDNPDVQGYVFNSRDVTERKIAEEEIKKLSIIARETVNAVIITDPEGKILWVNEAFTRITEFELTEVLGKKPGDFLQGDETNLAVVRSMRQNIKNEHPFSCDVVNYSKSGRKYWVRIQIQPQFDESGKLKYFFAIETDITKEKNAEEILRASEERYRYLFNNNPASIFIWDIDNFQILEVNDTAVQLYGYQKEELLTKTVLDLSLSIDHDKLKLFASKARQKSDFRSEIIGTHINKSGHEMFMNISSHRIRFKNKPVVLALATNITDKVILENELEYERLLKQQEITAAVISAQEQERQELGAELHDNINQILAGSLLYLGLAKKELPGGHPYLKETDNLISSAIDEIRNLSHSLIPPSLIESELLGAIHNIIDLTQKTSGIIISLQANDFDESNIADKLKLSIYRIIQEQFTNILKHADAQKVIVRLTQDNEKILLSIKDDGVGFDTTKKSDGVGLMNIKTRASLFNGEMNIISSPGNGCELRVLFN